MPAKQGLGLDEEPSQSPPPKEPTQAGEQRPVRRSERRARHLATKHSHLVAEHDDLNRKFAVVRAVESEQLEDSDERQIEEGQRHGPVSASPPCRRKSS